MQIVMDQVPLKPGFPGFGSAFIFCQFFKTYFIIFQSGVHRHQKSSNMQKIWQKMKKSLVQFTLNPFQLIYGYTNPILDNLICH